MDSEEASVLQTSTFSSVAQLVSKILRFRRAGQNDIHLRKLKLPGDLEFSVEFCKVEPDINGQKFLLMEKEVTESLLANVFLSISAIKASYAELQTAQVPFDPETVQATDRVIVAELRRISELKQSYFKGSFNSRNTALIAQQKEQQNLINTYSISVKRIEAELKERDNKILSLKFQLGEYEKKVTALENKLYPGRTIAALGELHLSGLNSTHFLVLLRFTYRSIRSFVKQMMKVMTAAGWDIKAAACAIQPELLHDEKSEHRAFAFESYVCQKMFSHFDKKDFNLSGLKDRCSCDHKRFFEEFSRLKSLKSSESLSCFSHLGKFCREKYLDLVHPNMELSLFGNLDRRSIINSESSKFPDSLFLAEFLEMARRIWLLHCMFFSFEQRPKQSIFQVGKGAKFSEMYMENVVTGADESAKRPLTARFSVVPGFVVGGSVIQCKVYVSTAGSSFA